MIMMLIDADNIRYILILLGHIYTLRLAIGVRITIHLLASEEGQATVVNDAKASLARPVLPALQGVRR